MRPPCRPLIALALALAGCGARPTTPREPDQYQGCATDENWRLFDDQQQAGLVKRDDANAPLFVTPKEGAVVAVAMKPTFEWQPTASAPGKKNGDVSCMVCQVCGALTTQHEPPVSGNTYDLQLAVAGTVVHRVVTTLQSWQPPDALLATLRGKSVTLTAVRAQLSVNEVKAGPFTATRPLPFSVAN